MAQILLIHHIQGLTDGVRSFADELRQDGHTVVVPDLFEGRTFSSIEDGFAFATETGFDVLRERGLAAAAELSGRAVFAGFSFGVTIAQELAQTRADAAGALLMYSCLPVSEYGDQWPDAVPVQIHGKSGDEFFAEDLEYAEALAASAPRAELFLYPGDQHLFADPSLPAYDPEAASLLLERVRAFLAAL